MIDSLPSVLPIISNRCDFRPSDILQQWGLVPQHTYSVLGFFESEDFNEGDPEDEDDNPSGVRLIKLRNPWGVANYTGPWSPGSAEWSTEDGVAAAAALAAAGKTSGTATDGGGVFYMHYNDFVNRLMTEVKGMRLPPTDVDARRLYFKTLLSRSYPTVEFPQDYGSEKLAHDRSLDVVAEIMGKAGPCDIAGRAALCALRETVDEEMVRVRGFSFSLFALN